jgi:hypothetical protein
MQGQLVNNFAPDLVQMILQRAESGPQSSAINLLVGVPPHSKPRRYLLDGQHLCQERDFLREARSHPQISVELRHGFHGWLELRAPGARAELHARFPTPPAAGRAPTEPSCRTSA